MRLKFIKCFNEVMVIVEILSSIFLNYYILNVRGHFFVHIFLNVVMRMVLLSEDNFFELNWHIFKSIEAF